MIRSTIVNQFFEQAQDVEITPLKGGLINSTYRLSLNAKDFILQKINTEVFTNPAIIVSNMMHVAKHLEEKSYSKSMPELIPNLKGDFLTEVNGGIWRMMNFIPNSVCYDQVQSLDQAYEAAKALGEWHRYCLDLDLTTIESSIDGFLDYKKRMTDFYMALETASEERLQQAACEINYLLENKTPLMDFLSANLPAHLIHSDAKISNFLFSDKNANLPLALIDWDTLMTGSLLIDFGDMVRTFANLKSEDDISEGQTFSSDYYQAIKTGFLEHLNGHLTADELVNFDRTAFVVVYIQAVRFLTDFLQNDTYYSTDYPLQNLFRTTNQIHWLKSKQAYEFQRS